MISSSAVMPAAIVLLAAGLLLIAIALLRRRGPASTYDAGRMAAHLQSLDTQLRQDITRRMDETHRAIDVLRLQADERVRREEEMLWATRRIESVFAGSSGRGKAGEHALAEALRALPQEMVARDVALNGRVVEFGLRLGDGRTLPIDSKWPATDLLARIEGMEDGADRAAVIREVEREVERRIREVAQYIAPGHTTPYALVALPDAALGCCTTVYREAHRRGVLLMSYSMAVPYLLALYRLHLEYAGNLDVERTRARLQELQRGLDELDATLENKLARAATMTQNAYLEAKQVTARLQAQLSASEISAAEPPPQLPD